MRANRSYQVTLPLKPGGAAIRIKINSQLLLQPADFMAGPAYTFPTHFPPNRLQPCQLLRVPGAPNSGSWHLFCSLPRNRLFLASAYDSALQTTGHDPLVGGEIKLKMDLNTIDNIRMYHII